MDLSRAPLACDIALVARLRDVEAAACACRALGAEDEGTVRRTETYFTLGRHRLKLSETDDARPVLVGYSAPEAAGAGRRQSRRRIVENPGEVRAALVRQWGVKAVIKTTRRTFVLRGRARVHLDRVESLGDFVEIEAAVDEASGYDEDAARKDVARVCRELGLAPRDAVAESYATLLAETRLAPDGK